MAHACRPMRRCVAGVSGARFQRRVTLAGAFIAHALAMKPSILPLAENGVMVMRTAAAGSLKDRNKEPNTERPL